MDLSLSMNAPRPLFPCYWCQWAICSNVGTDCLCQDKCQPGPPCPSPSLWSWVYYTRLWKSLARCLLRSATVRRGSGKGLVPRQKRQLWVWDRFSRLLDDLFPGGLCSWRVDAAKNLLSFFINNLFKNSHILAYEYVGHCRILQLSLLLFSSNLHYT